MKPLESLTSSVRSKRPRHEWSPADCGDIDIVIRADGAWYHEGAVIARAGLVRLFSSILEADAGQFFLVTPAERYRIQVEDAPFVLTDWCWQEGPHGPTLTVTTNVGDTVNLESLSQWRLSERQSQGSVPYIQVRAGLEARVPRSMLYQWVDHAVQLPGSMTWGLVSADEFFRLEM